MSRREPPDRGQLDLFQVARAEGQLAGEAQRPSPAAQRVSREARPAGKAKEDKATEKADLRQRLEPLLEGRLGSLTLTDNRSRILSVKPEGDLLAVRIHRVFTLASPETLRAAACFILGQKQGRRRPQRAIREHFERHHRPEPREARASRLRPVGEIFDLQRIRDDLNAQYFENKIRVDITWGRAPGRQRSRRRQRSIRLGSFVPDRHLIRVHPNLDRRWVPPFVVESVVYHEMLHSDLPSQRTAHGRRCIQSPEFRRRERLFHAHEKATSWIEAHFDRLTQSRRG